MRRDAPGARRLGAGAAAAGKDGVPEGRRSAEAPVGVAGAVPGGASTVAESGRVAAAAISWRRSR